MPMPTSRFEPGRGRIKWRSRSGKSLCRGTGRLTARTAAGPSDAPPRRSLGRIKGPGRPRTTRRSSRRSTGDLHRDPGHPQLRLQRRHRRQGRVGRRQDDPPLQERPHRFRAEREVAGPAGAAADARSQPGTSDGDEHLSVTNGDRVRLHIRIRMVRRTRPDVVSPAVPRAHQVVAFVQEALGQRAEGVAAQV
jgi:hypothetical protein